MKCRNTARIGLLHIAVASVMSLGCNLWAGPQDVRVITAYPGALVPDPAEPWGELETYSILLEPPDSHVINYLRPDLPNSWVFPNSYSQDDVHRFYLAAGLSENQAQRLLNPANYNYEDGAILSVQPPLDLLSELDSDVRATLYTRLRSMPENRVRIPIRELFAEGFEAMAVGSGLSDATIKEVSRLSYYDGGVLTFSDTNLVWSSLLDQRERWRLMKTVRRERSWMVKVVAPKDRESLQVMGEYFQAGEHNRSIEPILHSIAGGEGDGYLDFVHLLPPTPRRLLMTFATPMMGNGRVYPDCFWTAGNFFKNPPSDRHLDGTRTYERLKEEYEMIMEGPMKFGDLILLFNESTTQAMHACNYLAGDYVYTKNGKGFTRPFIISTINEVLSAYSTVDEIRVLTFRHR